jgi:hypothetical protein
MDINCRFIPMLDDAADDLVHFLQRDDSEHDSKDKEDKLKGSLSEQNMLTF